MRGHRWERAGLKPLAIILLLFGPIWLLIGKSRSDFAPLVFADFIATFVGTGTITHQYLPAEFFRYIIIESRYWRLSWC